MALLVDDPSLISLYKRKDNLLKELSNIDKAIAALTGGLEKSWASNAIECIKNWGEFVTTSEILNCLFYEREYLLEDKVQRKKYVVALSVALHKMVKENILTKIDVPKYKGCFYGLPEWVIEGIPKEEYYESLKIKTNGKIAI